MSANRSAKSAFAWIAWRTPGRFELAKRIAPGLRGRALVFHEISEQDSPLTAGLGVSLTPAAFERTLEFLQRHYTFVDLSGWLRSLEDDDAPKPALLLTFDDAYASVARVALPICRRLGIPALMFMNSSFIENASLALDNLICFVVNTHGLGLVENVAGRGFRRPLDVYSEFLPTLDIAQRKDFAGGLAEAGGVDEAALLAEFRPYLTRRDVRDLVNSGFEIGNHTSSHAHLRSLSSKDCRVEIEENKLRLEELTGLEVKSFSYPYGAVEDSGGAAIETIRRSGHESAFLVEGRLNSSSVDRFRFMRVSLKSSSEAGIFSEIEVLPRLREQRERFR